MPADIPKYALRPHSYKRLAHPVQRIAGARRAPALLYVVFPVPRFIARTVLDESRLVFRRCLASEANIRKNSLTKPYNSRIGRLHEQTSDESGVRSRRTSCTRSSSSRVKGTRRGVRRRLSHLRQLADQRRAQLQQRFADLAVHLAQRQLKNLR